MFNIAVQCTNGTKHFTVSFGNLTDSNVLIFMSAAVGDHRFSGDLTTYTVYSLAVFLTLSNYVQSSIISQGLNVSLNFP